MPTSVALNNWSLSTDAKSKIVIDGYEFDNQSAKQAWSIQALDANSVRFELRDGDRHSWDVSAGHAVERVELAENLQPISNGTPIKISYGLLIEPGAKNTAWWTVLGQLHQDLATTGAVASPPFSIGMVGERMQIEIRWGSTAAPQIQTLFVDSADIQRGHLYDFKITTVFNAAGGGRLVVERDGVTLVDYSGPLGYAEQNGVYWAEGIYRADNATETMAVQYRGLDIETGTAVTLPSKDQYVAAPVFKVLAQQTAAAAATVTVSGTAKAGSTVALFEDGQKVATATVAADGTFSAKVGAAGAGAHAITAVATDATGRTGVTSAPTTVMITSSANLVSKLGTLSADASLGSIVLTDGHVLRVSSLLEVSYAQKKDADALSKIVGGYTVVLSQTVTGKSYDRQDTTYASDGHITEVGRWTGTKLVFDQIFASDGTQTLRTWTASGTSDLATFTAAGFRTHYESYTSAGKLAFTQDFRTDGSTTTHYFSATTGLETNYIVSAADKSRVDTAVNITGRDYTSQAFAYDATGRMVSQERFTATGVKIMSQTWGADGSKALHSYSATTGRETSSSVYAADGSHVETTFGITGKAYAAQALSYDATNRASGQSQWDATGRLVSQETWNADGSKKVYALDAKTGLALGYTLTAKDKSHVDAVFAVAGSSQLASSASYDGANHLLARQTYDPSTGKVAISEAWALDGSHVTTTYTGSVATRIDTYDTAGHAVSAKIFNAAGLLISTIVYHEDAVHALAARSLALALAPGAAAESDGGWTETSYAITGRSYTSEALTYDRAGHVLATSRWTGDTLVYAETVHADGSAERHSYDARTGAETWSQVVQADGSRTEVTSGITGKGYTGQTISFDAAGKALETVRWNGDKPVLDVATDADGSQFVKSWTAAGELTATHLAANGSFVSSERFDADGTRVYAEARHADGSRETHTYDGTTGVETAYTVFNADKSRVEVNLAVTGKAYATQHATYDAAGKLVEMDRHYTNDAGPLALRSSYHADGSSEVFNYDTAGRETSRVVTAPDGSKDSVTSTYAGSGTIPTTVREDHVGTAGQKLWTDATAADGSHAITASAGGLVLASHAAVTDVFTSAGSDTFSFKAGFGADVIRNFHAQDGALHDLIQIDHTLAHGFGDLVIRAVGSDTVIDFGNHNTITLANVAKAQLDHSDFLFV